MDKTTRKIARRVFLLVFALTVAALAVLRASCPKVAGRIYYGQIDEQAIADSIMNVQQIVDVRPSADRLSNAKPTGEHLFASVEDCQASFPDSNAIQMASAQLHGVQPVQNREEAEQRKDELVYIDSSPYYDIRELTQSIPYLVPSAAVLLQDIGRNFMDTLYVRELPAYRLNVTSVTRTKDDVERLLKQNKNATRNSCHQYGTTFDISYNHFTHPDGRDIFEGRLQKVLYEVVEDLRRNGRCWVKYERLQPVLHITVR